MTHSLLVVVLMVVGVSYGRQWTNLDELEDYLTNNYDGLEIGTRAMGIDVIFHETWLNRLDSNELPMMWPGGVIYYHIDGKANNNQRSLILDAMRVIEDLSCVKFRPSKRQEKLTIHVERDDDPGACYSNVGYIPSGGQLHLGKRCFQQGTIIHELLHTLGMDHQQSASNRDDYVTIHWENIPEDFRNNFQINSQDLPAEREFGYDYQSIMHYSSKGFHETYPHLFPSMTAKDPSVKLMQQSRMSHKDIKKLNRMYNCIKQ